MEIGRFKDIIKYSDSNTKRIETYVKDLYYKIGIEYERGILDIVQVARNLFKRKNYILIELPFSDKEIGAFCYKKDSFGYVLLNSSLSKVKANFALCHEIYHIFYQNVALTKRIELYLNENYYNYEEEFAANLFAGILLMPEKNYRSMFNKFKLEMTDEDTELTLVVKLMNYFKVPYMAALIRCYELDLLKDGNVLEKLLNIDSDQIENEFNRLWFDTGILKGTKKDDMHLLVSMVKEYGEKYSKLEYLSDRTVNKVLENMNKIYCQIKGE